jgi:hypothetical protein
MLELDDILMIELIFGCDMVIQALKEPLLGEKEL